MKTKIIAATAAILSFTVPVIFAGHGGGHGGGGFSGGGHVSGGRGYSGGMPGYAGGMRSYSGHYYGGGFRGYTGGGAGRAYSGYGRSYRQVYSSHAISRTGASGRHTFSAQKPYKQNFAAGQSGAGGTNRIAANNPRNPYGSRAGQQGLRQGLVSKQLPSTHNGKTGQGNWARNNPKNRNHFDQQTQNKLRNWQGNKSSWAEAQHRHRDNHDVAHNGHNHNHDGHHHHDHDWWHHHCTTVVWVDWGWWGWWDGWWYPAWGYDPSYYYSYDEPIYGYGGLPPDEIVANVQSQLQQLGYFSYAVDGVMGPLTREAIMRYQRDQRLPITGAIDSTTVGSLGLGS